MADLADAARPALDANPAGESTRLHDRVVRSGKHAPCAEVNSVIVANASGYPPRRPDISDQLQPQSDAPPFYDGHRPREFPAPAVGIIFGVGSDAECAAPPPAAWLSVPLVAAESSRLAPLPGSGHGAVPAGAGPPP